MKLPLFLPALFAFALPAFTRSPLIELPAHAQIRNLQFDALLRPRNASGAVGAPIVLHSAEPWKCMTWTFSGPSNEVTLTNVLTGKPFAVAEDSKQIFQAKPGTKTLLCFEPIDGGWKIFDVASGLVLTAPDADHVVLAPWRDEKSQKWRVEEKALSDLIM